MRIESDFLGEMSVPEDALYGIHSVRARENFPDSTKFPAEWFKACGVVKKACYISYRNFKKAALEKYPDSPFAFEFISDEVLDAMIIAAEEVSSGLHEEHFIIPAIQGGAGTSINLNINEIIANRALILLGHKPGEYSFIDPIEKANVFQSTNDVIPTALKVALMFLLDDLEKSINDLRSDVENLEKKHLHDIRLGCTQMQQAVPTSFGKLFGSYSDALSRDWWRVSKCRERLKPVNLGGGAIGTGIATPRFFIMDVVNVLAGMTSLPLARSENMTDTTSNLDAFAEVHAIMKSHAVNLEKMVSDLRLLSADAGSKVISIPERQTGSSIMPGKVNPVIPEFVISAVHQVYANDQIVTSLSAMGTLELNAYLPSIGCAMINSLKLLIAACNTIKSNLLNGLKVLTTQSTSELWYSPSVTTALIPLTGYNQAAKLARLMKEKNISVQEANKEMKLLSEEKLDELLKPENLLSMGFRLDDVKK